MAIFSLLTVDRTSLEWKWNMLLETHSSMTEQISPKFQLVIFIFQLCSELYDKVHITQH